MSCKICGRKATGIHYGVLSCEGCKAFYRRGMDNKSAYICYNKSKCIIKPESRQCKACRFRKCQELGMQLTNHAKKKDGSPKLGKKNAVTHTTEASLLLLDKTLTTATSSSPESSSGNESCGEGPRNGQAADYVNSSKSSTSIDSLRMDDLFPDVLSNTLELARITQPDVVNLEEESDAGFAGDMEDDELDAVIWEVLASTNTATSAVANVQPAPALPDMSNLNPFIPQYMDLLDGPARRMALTVQSVQIVTTALFGHQLTAWEAVMQNALLHGEIIDPYVTRPMLLEAIRLHNRDSADRQVQFAATIPGGIELEIMKHRCVNVGWKWLAFWSIHHAAFVKDKETYITIGPQQLRWNAHWQYQIAEPDLVDFLYKFCDKFNEIGLTQIETFLLLAIILFEPSGARRCTVDPDRKAKVEVVHRHYIDVLLDTLRHRCSDKDQLAEICQKLTGIFGALRLLHRVHKYYCRALTNNGSGTAPFIAIRDNRKVSVQEALLRRDEVEDCEFNPLSPMTFNTELY
ncbi:hypothetical protein BV898_00628 [Hypsibius exemplaris]|uniref:Nuclear receptor domain-containing protein n=1 Tax=Hypsibius exemplaris TaxID=2072580 RepID=A0A1W0XE05_HYPEX|nr:hypothetical protein BV898_00628 [Hypsibius exemplaris]